MYYIRHLVTDDAINPLITIFPGDPIKNCDSSISVYDPIEPKNYEEYCLFCTGDLIYNHHFNKCTGSCSTLVLFFLF